ncbi:rho GTPase-activating protein REN1 isoform X3 [Cajanus cajan]|uniref:rho GTPase-activating protein REN1 isoform X3 n=1 Tax=Cajanus cajan TaxID=3821 RepID=UPI0010FB975E|nr:rho GTPase-activating protein REN1 isoform X3 [Cajanus cajan]
MTNTSAELSQGIGGVSLPHSNSQSASQEHNQRSHGGNGNMIFKSGPLFISSKGIGWTSWKKRWFILTQTSLVFFRSDPNAVPQRGNEVNLTLGGIDLNNSGSVVIKPDKKLLTVQFPDVHDGRAFTLKAETTEDLYEWKTALENALQLAPSAVNVTEQNVKDREPVKSTVIGRPILLALEDVDGTPSFLEKALKFIEEHGANVEGILRQAADVDEVERRVREYEQGKVEFSPDEDAHVVGDCIKHVLRELPSSPVPASCCKALLESCRTERCSRVAAMRAAINDTFPEPNRRLLQRILMMMQIVASRKTVNRMSSSAVAACMAPLLLRPLLAGECEIENDFDVGGDGSVQLLQAAAAANHAQAICITLLEEYSSIFGEGSVSPDIYTDSEEDSGSESGEATDDDLSYDDDEDYDDEQDESIQGSDADDLVSESYSGTGDSEADDAYDDEGHDHASSSSKSSGVSEKLKPTRKLSSKSLEVSVTQHEDIKSSEHLTSPNKTGYVDQSNKPADKVEGVSTDQATLHNSKNPSPASCIKKSNTMSNGPAPRHRTLLGRTSARKNLSMESIDFPIEDEEEIERLEAARAELQTQIAEEVKANAELQSQADKQKKALDDRRLSLEHDVARLQEQLHKEKNSQLALENKTELEELALVEADLAYLERKVRELGVRLNAQLHRNHGTTSDFSSQPQQISNQERKLKQKADAEVAATSQSDRSISKGMVMAQQEIHIGRAENNIERKPESTPLSNKHPPTSSRKSGTKGEGANSTTSALTKLTSRLNFLKVGRSHVANELQNMDKGSSRSEKGKGSERPQTLPSPNRYGGSEAHSEKGKGSESVHISEKGLSKGKSHQSSDKLKKSDSQPSHHTDTWNQQPKHLERGRSEGHQTYNVDKGR